MSLLRSRFIAWLNYSSGDLILVVAGLFLFIWMIQVRSPDAFGVYALAQATISWLHPLVQMGTTATAPYYRSKYPDQWPELAGQMTRLRCMVTLAACVALVCIALFLPPLIKWTLISATSLLLAYGLQPDGLCFAVDASALIRRSRLISGLLPMPLVGWLYYLQIHPAWVFLPQAASALLAAAYQWHSLKLPYRRLWSKAPISTLTMARDAAKTTLAQFCVAGYSAVDLLLLGWIGSLSLEALGEYRIATRLIQIGMIPILGAMFAASSPMAMAYAQRNIQLIDRLERLYKWAMWTVGLAGGLLILFIAPSALAWIADKPLPLVAQLAPWLGLVYFALALQNPYTTLFPFIGLQKDYLIINSIGLAAALLYGLICIPLFQATGAALSIAGAYFTMWLIGRPQYHRATKRLLCV
jgi:O-antigen/teichoic acid export membrane protein